ncbi:hypothetical protein ACIPXV_30320 [Streptomyces libani]|uniref:hypothetical protein n=1 Tax=Streptomyces nigrescens TaxID=1920 RepID=UPI0038104100
MSFGETPITIIGNLASDPELKFTDTDEQAPDHAQKWPSPDEAYANAPHLVAETAMLTVTAADPETELDREWYLRHAAILDRVALHIACFDDEPGAETAAEDAEATAVILLDLDQAPRDYDPRAYVRQQYALWLTQQDVSLAPSHS